MHTLRRSILTTSAALTVAAVLTAGHAGAAAAQQPSADAILNRATAAWAKVRTMKGAFEQTIVNPITGGTMVTYGLVEQQRKPSRIAVRFTEPAGDVIVADGTALWLYLPSTTPGQVIKQRLGAAGAANVDLTAQFLDSPRTRYTITVGPAATVSGRTTRALHLVPKTAGSVPFTRATVWVDDRDGLVRQFEVTDQNGLTRKVRMTAMNVNVPVAASSFRFTPPKGTRVVDQTR